MSKKKKEKIEKAETTKPFLSVFIPTYMRPRLLENCLNHLLDVSQQGVNLEVLIYDSSTDSRNESIVHAFKEKVNGAFNVHYDRRDYDDIGWKAVRACKEANGEYIAYIADDDYFDINNLKEALYALKHNPKIHGWFATWQLWDDENQTVVNKTNNMGVNWVASASKTYNIKNIVDLAQEVIVHNVCPEIYIMKTDTARKALLDWRYPEEQLSLFILFRVLRFGDVHVSNTPFYKYCEVRKKSLLENDLETQTHYGERLYKEAPFMTRFSREWFVAQAFREAGFDHIPEDAQAKILKAINFEYIQRLKGNGIVAALRYKEYQLAHRYISTMASWNPTILKKEELYEFEKFYLVAYALQSIEKQIKNSEDCQKIQVLGFGENDVTTYFKNGLGDNAIKAKIIDDVQLLDDEGMILVPTLKHRKKLTTINGYKESKVIALEDVMNTLRMIRDPISCDAFVKDGFKV